MTEISSHTLRLRVSKPAAELHARVLEGRQKNLADSVSYTLDDSERKAAAELVDRGLCFYSMDRDHIISMRHTGEHVPTTPT